MNKLKVLELFAGIGACSKALERLGIEHEIVDAVEIDKYAIKSFNAIHNTNFEPQDICEWDKDIEVDLIMHGSPCQDFSLSGLQKSGDKGSGTRSSLMWETVRIVEKLKPKYVIWENVKNLLSKKHKHNFDAYLETMKQLGYINYYQVLNAKDYGIPQNRERVFTVSIRADVLFQRATFEEKENTLVGTCFKFQFPPKQELKLKLKDMLEDEVDEKYYFNDLQLDRMSKWKSYQNPLEKVLGVNSISPTITTRIALSDGGGINASTKLYCEQLANEANLRNNFKNKKIRYYTELDCWLLMGFEKEDFNKAKDSLEKLNLTVNQIRGCLYKQAGNSIVVNVLEAILTNLLK